MSTHTTKGKKRKSQGKRKYLSLIFYYMISLYITGIVSDISTSHNIVAPYEIFENALGLLQLLVSGYLFDHRSFTSLYNQR